jgi:hypothetical protein
MAPRSRSTVVAAAVCAGGLSRVVRVPPGRGPYRSLSLSDYTGLRAGAVVRLYVTHPGSFGAYRSLRITRTGVLISGYRCIALTSRRRLWPCCARRPPAPARRPPAPHRSVRGDRGAEHAGDNRCGRRPPVARAPGRQPPARKSSCGGVAHDRRAPANPDRVGGDAAHSGASGCSDMRQGSSAASLRSATASLTESSARPGGRPG